MLTPRYNDPLGAAAGSGEWLTASFAALMTRSYLETRRLVPAPRLAAHGGGALSSPLPLAAAGVLGAVSAMLT